MEVPETAEFEAHIGVDETCAVAECLRPVDGVSLRAVTHTDGLVVGPFVEQAVPCLAGTPCSPPRTATPTIVHVVTQRAACPARRPL